MDQADAHAVFDGVRPHHGGLREDFFVPNDGLVRAFTVNDGRIRPLHIGRLGTTAAKLPGSY